MFGLTRIFRHAVQQTVTTTAICSRQYCTSKTKLKQNIKPTKNTKDSHAAAEDTENNGHQNSTEEQTETSNQEQQHQQNENDDGQSRKFDTQVQKNLMIRGSFEHVSVKNRKNYLTMIKMFEQRDVHRRNHVEFIYAALKHMKEFGVERDLAVYKALIDIMPKGKMIPTNMFQAEFVHYPKQQYCMIDLLEQMECNGVMPDYEIEDMLMNTFGKYGHATHKFWRMMYWMPKFKNLSPWLLPNPVPEEAFELAKLAVQQMCSVDVQSQIEIFQTKDIESSIDDTWIVSGQSVEQKELLQNHPKGTSLQIEGPFEIWLRDRTINYFTLIGDAVPDHLFEDDVDEDDVKDLPTPSYLQFLLGRKPNEKKEQSKKIALKRSMHQQDDGTIYAICATGTSTKDSLLSWIRLLECHGNPQLANIPVLFKFRSPVDEKSLVSTT